MSFSNFTPQERIHVPSFFFRHDARFHRLTTRRKLIDYGDIQIAVQDQRQRPRNRRGGHNQHVRSLTVCAALFLQQGTLLNTESVLFVCYHQSKLLIGHIFANQRMGTENSLPFT